jgi:hypothetical protein
MKRSAISTLIAAPLLSLSSLAFAADPVPAEPMLLTASEMDTVTAAGPGDWANIFQLNVSPVTVVQLNILSNGINSAEIVSGNFAGIFQ